MSTSNQQQRGGRRQPFGYLHANTLSSATLKAKGSGAAAGNGGGDNAAAAHSSDTVKNESKKKFRGVLTSIVSRSKGKKKERSSGSSSSEEDVSMLESPTKKTRVMMEEDLKPSADATDTDAAAVLPREDTQAGPLCHNEFDASDVARIFRERLEEEDADDGLWDDEMEDMLELKQANPILNDSMDGEEDNIEEGRIDPSKSLAKELDENVAGEPDLKPSADATDTTAAAVLPMEDTQAGPLCYNEFAPSDVAAIFRQRPAVEDADNGFWDDEMESMLELKQANPILNDSMDGEEDNTAERRIDPSNSLAKELDENVSGEPLSWSNRLEEGKDGFKIHMDE